jgi:phosphomevalonate kinase
MRIKEITTIQPIKPLTPQQSKINTLKQQKERATTNLKAERERQKKTAALANISKNNAVLSNLNKTF